MQERAAESAARLAGLRVPLSRIELAASRLLRLVSTPRARAFAEGISDAVADIDEQIARVLQDVVGSRPHRGPLEDCRPVIAELHGRIEPSLRARKIEWIDAADDQPSSPAMGHRRNARAAALALLESGMDLASGGGGLSLSVTSDENRNRYGVVLHVVRAESAKRNAEAKPTSDVTDWPNAFDTPRRCARTNGGELEILDQPGVLGAILWLDREAVACGD